VLGFRMWDLGSDFFCDFNDLNILFVILKNQFFCVEAYYFSIIFYRSIRSFSSHPRDIASWVC